MKNIKRAVSGDDAPLVWKEIQAIHHLPNINVPPQVPITRRGAEAAATPHRRCPRAPTGLWEGGKSVLILKCTVGTNIGSRARSKEYYVFVKFTSFPLALLCVFLKHIITRAWTRRESVKVRQDSFMVLCCGLFKAEPDAALRGYSLHSVALITRQG